MNIVEPFDVVRAIAALVTALGTIGGFVYWLARSSAGLATKSYVEEHVNEELEPIEDRAATALEHARRNESELQELKSLIEGGNSQFDQGIIDFLDENIDRTNEIKDELDEIRRSITTLKHVEQADDRTDDD
ncbi:hypothetical protein [Halomicrococcus gelatinilyticus]|uniref:hypothetical protein n=1 Tax=Halomicrococcus gelatinilyticus TaxID=1702103 RepID=UPI002E165CA5